MISSGGPDDDIPPDLDWSAEEGFSAQDLGTIYAQVGWEPAAAAAGGGGTAGGAGGGIHPFVHHLGGGELGAGDTWIRGVAQDQLSVWGVQPPPGLSRQYATTRHGDRGAGGLVSGSGHCC